MKTAEYALKDLNELIYDLENHGYVPPKFRKSIFTNEKRLAYVSYLQVEKTKLQYKLKTLN